jgi:hypothetical protein
MSRDLIEPSTAQRRKGTITLLLSSDESGTVNLLLELPSKEILALVLVYAITSGLWLSCGKSRNARFLRTSHNSGATTRRGIE